MNSPIKNIPLNQLMISPDNVRVVSARKEEDKQLLASIRAEGILQNLVVVPNEGPGVPYKVVAGGRRHSALCILLKEGTIDEEYPVPCSVRDRENAVAVSLSENIHAPMHPADEFEGYKKLANEGKSPKEIAQAFGQSVAQVKKLLKLGSVAPALVNRFRNGEMSLDCIMAFTLSDDHDEQLACWKEVSRGYVSPYDIRRFLTKDSIASSDGLAKFVGLKAYKKAGGSFVEDLFQSKTLITDQAKLQELAQKKLESHLPEVATEGWKWVEISLEGQDVIYNLRSMTAERVNVPQSLTDKLTAYEEEFDLIESKPYTETTDEDNERLDELHELIEQVEEEMNRYQAFTDEQKVAAGAIITFGDNGNLIVHRGVLKPGEKPVESNHGQAQAGDDILFGNSTEAPIESQSLRDDLSAYFGQAFQARLMNDPELCYDMLVFELAENILNGKTPWEHTLAMNATAQTYAGIGIDETKAATAINEAYAKLNTAWLAHEEHQARFSAFQKLTKREKAQLMAFCVARSSRPHPQCREDHALRVVEDQIEFSLKDYWRPTKENYFGRLKKADLLNLGDAVVGEGFEKEHAKSKKGDLAELIESLPAFDGWMPKCVSE